MRTIYSFSLCCFVLPSVYMGIRLYVLMEVLAKNCSLCSRGQEGRFLSWQTVPSAQNSARTRPDMPNRTAMRPFKSAGAPNVRVFDLKGMLNSKSKVCILPLVPELWCYALTFRAGWARHAPPCPVETPRCFAQSPNHQPSNMRWFRLVNQQQINLESLIRTIDKKVISEIVRCLPREHRGSGDAVHIIHSHCLLYGCGCRIVFRNCWNRKSMNHDSIYRTVSRVSPERASKRCNSAFSQGPKKQC